MGVDLQKASMWKRISAWLFDAIITAILAVAVALGLSALFQYDTYSVRYEELYAQYEKEYGVSFEIQKSEYDAFTPEQKEQFDVAMKAFSEDPEVLNVYGMIYNLILLIASLSILAAFLVWEFVVPLWIGNGQTLGKKIFGVCLMRVDGVRCTAVQLFVRTLLGKYTVGTMIPVFLLLMLFLGTLDIFGLVLLIAVPVSQLIILGVTKNNSLIHDLMAGTVVVDHASQRIFPDTESLIAYCNRMHAEEVKKQGY